MDHCDEIHVGTNYTLVPNVAGGNFQLEQLRLLRVVDELRLKSSCKPQAKAFQFLFR